MAKAKAKSTNKKNVRDTKSGRFVKKGEAKKRPSTTVSETRSKSKKVPCPDCGDSPKPGLNPLDYTETCSTCKGAGKVRQQA